MSKKISGNSNSLYTVLYAILARFLRFIFRVELITPENEPMDVCGMIVCANHISLLDPVIVAASLKHQVCFMAKEELFRVPFLRGLIRAFGAFPVKRGVADVGAIKHVVELVGEGKTVGMFAQGKRCKGRAPEVSDVKPGIGMVTARSRATVLPVAIVTKGYRILPLRKTKIVIGEPIRYDDLVRGECEVGAEEKKSSLAEYKRISETVFAEVVTLTENNRL